MKTPNKVASIATFLFVTTFVYSKECPTFTPYQNYLLALGYTAGLKHNLHYETAAIIWQESFWGDDVRKQNLTDGEYGSYGVMQVQLSTSILEIYDLELNDTTLDRMKYSLVNNDLFAIETGLKYLNKHSKRHNSNYAIKRYNGWGEMADNYREKILDKIEMLEYCGISLDELPDNLEDYFVETEF